MKKIALVFIGMALAVLLSLGVLSQLSPLTYSETSVEQATDEISVEERQDCTMEFYTEIADVIDTCNYYHNYSVCTNASGTGTGCIAQQRIQPFSCKTGQTASLRNQTSCTSQQKIYIEVEGDESTLAKELDYSFFGPCVREVENECLVITCVSYYDGAHNGQFTDCLGGKSCQKTVICEDGTSVYYKNGGEFKREDPAFFLEKMELEEVGP